jgi:UDP-N-acetylmuramoyl-tripeptide--D-alanyl-D-alanine ligase
MEINTLYQKFCISTGVSTDTRTLKQGMIFVAIKGENLDANEMVGTALKQGASVAITQNPEFSNHPDCYFCNDTLIALQDLALLHRKQLKATFIAITGTNGKTTTKELMREALSTAGSVQATEGNLNNHIGVPLTLLKIKNDTDFAIIEMGANHPGEIDALCKIALPHYGLITNIGHAHLEGFGGFEGVVKTKSELYQFIKQNGEAVFVNEDDQLLMSLSASQKQIRYGNKTLAAKTEINNIPQIEVDWTYNNKVYKTSTQLIGDYNLPNILAAISIGLHFGGEAQSVHEKLIAYTPGNMRSQWVETARNSIILDAYNANPSSMSKAISNFQAMKGENKIVILGDMLELGKYAADEHRKILEQLTTMNLHKVFLVGPEFLNWKEKFPTFAFFASTSNAILELQTQQISNSLLLLKGSRGIGVDRIKDIL